MERFARIALRMALLVLLAGALLAAACSGEHPAETNATNQTGQTGAMDEAPTGVPGMPDNINLVCGDNMPVTAEPTMLPLQLHVGEDAYDVSAEQTPLGMDFVGKDIVLSMKEKEITLLLGERTYNCRQVEE
ncbi:hypothetical protein [Oceanidesulfovibrio marinus]|uniref:Membrane-bound lysozyme-inhibitor of c-type lysozyme n=1 Tax=Oceanidesulfovibrio marinus TaxID=370038 RepID=A0A6P1ZE25_9BACT|nr:hypothetical protein [Oceanidesulfovibrio marinus]QJT08630.1 hypothetical protein E8L03_06695 [Oceanidesulfovibrio marinus]TVM32533.1 hypothetical protein DQK91_14765 [Oceanidesulfovibrio marinus]